MIFRKKRRRKKIKTKSLWWIVFILVILLFIPLPSQTGSTQGISTLGRWISSSWESLRISSERGVDALNGVTVIGSGDEEGTGITKDGRVLSSSETEEDILFDESLEWSFSLYPNYYAVLGMTNLDLTAFPSVGEISYSDLDNLGRTRTVRGSLTYENVAASYGVRQEFGADASPSGWTSNVKVSIPWLNDKVYNGYFWNRSHLIADSLGGDAIRQNVITGTRTQNVGGTDQQGGMRYTEKLTQIYLEGHHDVVVYYQAEPVYFEDELIPRYVLVSVLSSDGAIDQEVVVFNSANGYTIDYYTGSFYETIE